MWKVIYEGKSAGGVHGDNFTYDDLAKLIEYVRNGYEVRVGLITDAAVGWVEEIWAQPEVITVLNDHVQAILSHSMFGVNPNNTNLDFHNPPHLGSYTISTNGGPIGRALDISSTGYFHEAPGEHIVSVKWAVENPE